MQNENENDALGNLFYTKRRFWKNLSFQLNVDITKSCRKRIIIAEERWLNGEERWLNLEERWLTGIRGEVAQWGGEVAQFGGEVAHWY
jgi:hypothetical protein